jgi:hypothetical protein
MVVKKKAFWIIIGIILLTLFWWFQIRPARIRSECGLETALLYNKDTSGFDVNKFIEERIGRPIYKDYEGFYKFYYQKCLDQHGLSK